LPFVETTAPRLALEKSYLLPGERLVQAWRAASWKPEQYSIAAFSLTAQGANTKLSFEHRGFPGSGLKKISSETQNHAAGGRPGTSAIPSVTTGTWWGEASASH
jgi:hypothetical protein